MPFRNGTAKKCDIFLEPNPLNANGRVDVQIALIMAVLTADYWGNLHRPTIGLRSAAEHTDRWATATRPFAPRSGENDKNNPIPNRAYTKRLNKLRSSTRGLGSGLFIC
jgi:hypothetical protein